MQTIEIYTRPGCDYCSQAKMLLNSKSLVYIEYDVYAQPEKLLELRQRVQYSTYPQIFIDDCAIGGFDDLAALENNKKLPATLHYVQPF